MDTVYRRIALIPSFEPDEKLTEVLKDVSSAGFETFVVDDGSGKEYKDVFSAAEEYAHVISYDENKGKGYALKTGIKEIKRLYGGESYVVVTMDSDGQHTAKDAIKVCDKAVSQPGTLVLGSRRLEKKTPLKSKIGNAITRFVYRLSTGIAVYDTQTGLRAFTDGLTDDILSVPGDRYEYEMNVLLDFSRKKVKITETEIETIYFEKNAGTHFDPLKDSLRIYKQILKFSASSLVSFCVDFIFYSLFCFIFVGGMRYGIELSNVLARVISSSVNYTLNRKLVFKSDKKLFKSALEYFALAAVVLAGNTLVLDLLVKSAGMNKYLAKILTEMFFFVFSFFVQRVLVFKKSKEG